MPLPPGLQREWHALAAQVLERLSCIKRSFAHIACLGIFPLCKELQEQYPQAQMDTDLSSSEYDLIINWAHLHNVNNWKMTLQTYHQYLKPDGLFLAGFFGGDTLQEWRKALIQTDLAVHNQAYQRFVPFVRLKDATQALQATGFVGTIGDCQTLSIDYQNLDDLRADLSCFEHPHVFEAPPLSKQYATILKTHAPASITVEWLWLLGWRASRQQQKPLTSGSGQR